MRCVLWNDALGLCGGSVWRPVVGVEQRDVVWAAAGVWGTARRVKEDYVGVRVVAPT